MRRFATLAPILFACALLHGPAGALVLDGGVDNTFAISSADGNVWAWGGNVGGKLGNGATINSSMPVPAKQSWMGNIALGFYHTCSWDGDSGAAKCWGWNANGQLGDGTLVNKPVPIDVNGLASGVAAMAAGSWHTCALMDTGGVKCWGTNSTGQLGTNLPYDSFTPADVVGLSSGVAAIAAGERHTCALTTSGGVKCWGGNLNGQVGDNSTTQRPTPVDVIGLTSGVTAIAAGAYHTCALTASGAMKCWGQNAWGQLGIGSQADSLQAATVSGLSSGVLSIAAGSYHTCAVMQNGTAKCWGENADGEVGNGAKSGPVLVPTNVSGLSAAGSTLSIKVGFHHTCALTSGRQVLCWGANSAGELGNNSTTQSSVPVATWYLGANVVSLESGGQHNCAVYMYPGQAKFLFCWGDNTYGGIGDNTTFNRLVPTSYNMYGYDQVLYATAISAGMSHTLAIRYDGTVWAWGANHRGQLGVGRNAAPESCFTPFEGTINCSSVAVRVPGLRNVIAVGAGWGHSIALKDDGTVWAWGDNQFGQLGDGGLATSYTPRQVVEWDFALPHPLGGVAQIAAGYFHNVAMKSDGMLVAWGRGDHGQLGNGQFSDSSMAVNVSLAPVDPAYATISSKGSHTLALVYDTVWAWGLNAYGQVGNGSTFDVATPVQVLSGMSEISAGMSTSMARGSSVRAWGLNTVNQLGTSTFESCGGFLCAKVPASIGYQGAHGIAAGGAHGIVVKSDDTLALFGDNAAGQLGNRSGNFGDHFAQASFDPAGMMFPGITEASGTSIGANSTGTGLSLNTLGGSIDFGLRGAGSTSTISMELKNLDPTDIMFSSITVSGAGFGVTDTCPDNPNKLAANGGTCTITISFSPPIYDSYYGTLEILSDAVDNQRLTYGIVGSAASAPSVPTNVVAVAGDGQATVTFSPPADSGGAAITSYTVRPSSSFSSATGTDYVNGITVTGLTNGTAYTFTVTATNAVNLTSAPSAPSNSVTPKKAPTTNTLTSGLNPSPLGTAVTFTVTLTGSPTPTGTVAFKDGGTVIAGCGSVSLVSGSAQCTTSALPVGSRSITAQYAGDGSFSGSVSNTVTQAVQPALTSVKIGLNHSNAGYFEVSVDPTKPLGGTVSVDSRAPAAGFRNVFFAFNSAVNSATASITTGNAQIGSTGGAGIGLYVTNVPDNKRVTITLANINGTGQSVSASMGFLVGDVDGSRSVTEADIAAIKSHAGESVVSGNFVHDVNLSGAITAADILAAKGRLNLSIP